LPRRPASRWLPRLVLPGARPSIARQA
jgi:hypothetical protein